MECNSTRIGHVFLLEWNVVQIKVTNYVSVEHVFLLELENVKICTSYPFHHHFVKNR